MNAARQYLKSIPILLYFHYWIPDGICFRNGKKTMRFRAPSPAPGQFMVLDPDPRLYLSGDGGIEYVHGDPLHTIITRAMIEEGLDIIEEKLPYHTDYAFEGIMVDEEGGVELSFLQQDAMLYRPSILVNLKTRTVEKSE